MKPVLAWLIIDALPSRRTNSSGGFSTPGPECLLSPRCFGRVPRTTMVSIGSSINSMFSPWRTRSRQIGGPMGPSSVLESCCSHLRRGYARRAMARLSPTPMPRRVWASGDVTTIHTTRSCPGIHRQVGVAEADRAGGAVGESGTRLGLRRRCGRAVPHWLAERPNDASRELAEMHAAKGAGPPKVDQLGVVRRHAHDRRRARPCRSSHTAKATTATTAAASNQRAGMGG